ncbi:glycoside hydrolase family 3 N-terminal domain-containing protein [Sulfuriroseicoccus oceanibius]|uniref:beta-N-acetylhexosaminidase n=1 Tax=Sulfuriroseicoccus oceanibius TaxID=2707525 RepID=A0A6B3L2U5_9BACT|nr:glycoside hydrolase family 3 N-terminal domain-containing protein [Sulfuriroseicoccus oceanibius]QQL44287.1 glycoside hydrolase family 3 protein [Sulfuriroseicoccus oceanibius]
MNPAHLGQFLILGIPGTTIDAPLREWLKSINPGGYILFGRNIESPRQVHELITDLRSINPVEEPIIGIDEEGGRVSRLRPILDHPLPSPGEIAANHTFRNQSFANLGLITAEVLKFFGFTMNFAPVLDRSLGSDTQDGVLRQRCFGTTSMDIISRAGLFLNKLERAGIHGCGKHFPTYTGAGVDPHHQLPTINGDVNALLAGEMAPFAAMLPDLRAVMTAHAWFKDLDPQSPGLPASLSQNVITQLLRNQLSYDGLVMTDDLDMAGAQANCSVPEAAAQALAAGTDMLLVCHKLENVPAIIDAIGKLPHHVLQDAASRIEQHRRQIKPVIAAFNETELARLNKQILKFRIQVFGSEERALDYNYDAPANNVESY